MINLPAEFAILIFKVSIAPIQGFKHMNVSEIIAPAWYIEARTGGKSKEDLRDAVAAECLNALKRRAARRSKPAPERAEPEVVGMTIDMYEFAFSRAGAG